jgi:hypothetical protein
VFFFEKKNHKNHIEPIGAEAGRPEAMAAATSYLKFSQAQDNHSCFFSKKKTFFRLNCRPTSW